MVKNVNSTVVARYATLEKQAEVKNNYGNNPFDINVYDKVEISADVKSASLAPQSKNQVPPEPVQRSNLFADVFLSNVNTHGIKGAYDLAWAAMRSEFSISRDFPVQASEKQDSLSIDISAYY